MRTDILINATSVTFLGEVDCAIVERDCTILPGEYYISKCSKGEFILASARWNKTGYIYDAMFFTSEVFAIAKAGSN